MSRSGYAPWQDDTAADWFADLQNRTGLAECIAATLEQDVDSVSSIEIRAAAFVLLMLGRNSVWPYEYRIKQLNLAAEKLQECANLERAENSPADSIEPLINKEISLLKLMSEHGSKAEQVQVLTELWQKWLF